MSCFQVGLIENPHNLLEMVFDIFALFVQSYSKGRNSETTPKLEGTLMIYGSKA